MSDHTSEADVADSYDLYRSARVLRSFMKEKAGLEVSFTADDVECLASRLEAVEKDTQLHTDIYVAKMHSSESVKRVADALLSLVPTLSKE